MAAQRDVKRRVVMFTWFASFIIIVVLLGCLGAGEVCELRWGLGRVIFSLDFEASRKRYIEMLPKTLETYSIYFRVKRWVLGDDISYVDFMMYETLDWIRVFHAEALAHFEALTDYCARFEALPGVGEYRTSAQFVSWPIFGPLAKWGFRERP
ncbi:glutathione S-transferase class-mu 26 kDa isozyme 47-like [Ixodes scapularis]|uniref:glutathione S-transferase class-mu 26 kDa isozyme 47-like n=1 Tax=Ixodes scapularis TaxID=6945 RepID=UPI001A9CFEDB|nr:glutathione S-transferase class-mu 26 kDa isozyme 47-like [Ixodes scapularis]